MKTLFLLRHAQAVAGAGSLPDSDRPLNEQGRVQAERVGKYFKDQQPGLDLVLSSTAQRARETTEIFLKGAECVTEVRYEQRIYEASRQQLLEMVWAIEEDKSSVLLVGHNPGLGELLQKLTGSFEGMGTSSLAKIDLKSLEGANVEPKGSLDWLVKPNELIY